MGCVQSNCVESEIQKAKLRMCEHVTLLSSDSFHVDSDEIDAQLRRDRIANAKTMVILLLGGGDSGKVCHEGLEMGL